MRKLLGIQGIRWVCKCNVTVGYFIYERYEVQSRNMPLGEGLVSPKGTLYHHTPSMYTMFEPRQTNNRPSTPIRVKPKVALNCIIRRYPPAIHLVRDP